MSIAPIWPKRSEGKNKTTRMRTKVRNKKNNSQIKKPHLKRIPNKDDAIAVFNKTWKQHRPIELQ